VKRLKIASQRYVGVFWYYSGCVFSKKISTNDLVFTSGTKDPGFFHQSVWTEVYSQIKNEFPEVPEGLDYKDIVRGRIWQNEVARQFVLLSAKKVVESPLIVYKILEEFEIPSGSNISLEHDEKYDLAKY
jgi:hypothetical protein